MKRKTFFLVVKVFFENIFFLKTSLFFFENIFFYVEKHFWKHFNKTLNFLFFFGIRSPLKKQVFIFSNIFFKTNLFVFWKTVLGKNRFFQKKVFFLNSSDFENSFWNQIFIWKQIYKNSFILSLKNSLLKTVLKNRFQKTDFYF